MTTILGRFTVRPAIRTDNPAFPVYLVFLGDVLIGKSFSIPDIGCCEWLELQQREQTMYAYSSAKLKTHTSKAIREKRWTDKKIYLAVSEEESPA